MREQEYLNLKNHIKRDFSKEQANDLLMLVDHIKHTESEIDRLTQVTRLLDTKNNLKFSVFAQKIEAAALKSGVDIDLSEFIIKSEEKKEDTNGSDAT